jgi:site-specific recombinase XerD
VWETIYGKIPDGQIVVFKDGDRANFDIENLELITREENMRRNTIQNYPDDLQKVIRIFHKLSKKVSAHEKQVARPI